MLGIYMGVDPGENGGLALINADNIAIGFPMPSTPQALARLFTTRIIPAKPAYCLIEHLHALPNDKRGSIATWSLARSYGMLIGMLALAEIQYEEIEPRSWQKALGIEARWKAPKAKAGMALVNYRPEESYHEFKMRLLGVALKLFPRMDITKEIADALLLAEVCRRMQGGFQGRSIR